MVLVPFTGINNHKKCVSFGTGLLSKEDIASYEWLLKAFIQTHKREPIVVLTDQDPSMKQAVEMVFKQTTHRFCMWHIMDKVAAKVGPTLCNADCPFTQRLRDIVWNEKINAPEFEKEWVQLMANYHLEGHKWLSELYKIRDHWIPAYFRDTPMSGLMKTTSLSEGQNNFYNHYLSSKSTLVEFFSRFECALDSQKHMQRMLDFESRTKQLTLRTDLNIEKDASNIFTLKVFKMVQEEICNSSFGVLPIRCIEISGLKQYELRDNDSTNIMRRTNEVAFINNGSTIRCSCMHFERFGILCRHVFYVLRMNDIHHVPEKYISSRWKKDVFTIAIARLQNAETGTKGKQCDADEDINNMYADLAYCIQVLRDDKEGIKAARERHHKLITELTAGHGKTLVSKHEVIKQLVGVAQPDEVTILPPVGIRNKGCGTSKRMISDRDIAIAKSTKAARKCKTCHEVTHHDSRNCPKKNAK